MRSKEGITFLVLSSSSSNCFLIFGDEWDLDKPRDTDTLGSSFKRVVYVSVIEGQDNINEYLTYTTSTVSTLYVPEGHVCSPIGKITITKSHVYYFHRGEINK